MRESEAGGKGTRDAESEGKPLGAEAPEIVDRATEVGTTRLTRPLLAEMVTAFIGAMSISFGGVAMAIAGGIGNELGGEPLRRLLGALFFPVGFVILLIGKSELFTENFLLPVMGVLEKRAKLRSLLRLWGVSLTCNLLGAAVFAWIIGRPGVLDQPARDEMIAIAAHKLSQGFPEAFVSALFAGWLMTGLTWLLLSCRSVGERLAIIWMIAALIVLGRFNHAVISACEVFMAWSFGMPIDAGVFVWHELTPAVLGNLVGGVVFVTALHYLQARGMKDGMERRRIRRRLQKARERMARKPAELH